MFNHLGVSLPWWGTVIQQDHLIRRFSSVLTAKAQAPSLVGAPHYAPPNFIFSQFEGDKKEQTNQVNHHQDMRLIPDP